MSDIQEKEHLAWWRGFHFMKELVFQTLKKNDIDFSRCTNTDQICNTVKKEIIKEVRKINKGER